MTDLLRRPGCNGGNLKTATRWRRKSANPILQNRYPIMEKCLNIGKNIGKQIHRSITSHVMDIFTSMAPLKHCSRSKLDQPTNNLNIHLCNAKHSPFLAKPRPCPTIYLLKHVIKDTLYEFSFLFDISTSYLA